MNFKEVIDRRCEKIKQTLRQKNKEYGDSLSPFHNFIEAARKQNTTPEKALMGMKVKHTVSIDDLVNMAENNPGELDTYTINEKIGDEINYLILLEGMLREHIVEDSNEIFKDTLHNQEHISWPDDEFGIEKELK